MFRSLVAVLVLFGAHQAAETFRISKASLADVQQDILEAVDAASQRTTEVFPGAYTSPSGAAVVTRIHALIDRVDEGDRNALIASKATAGFDRSIIKWRAQPDGRAIVLAVRYYRDALFRLELEMSDDYGRADPVDPARYEFFAIAVCARTGTTWTCSEEQLADVAAKHKLPQPQTRQDRIVAAEKLVEIVSAGK